MYSKVAVEVNCVDNDINFPLFAFVRCPTETFELTIGISIEFPVTLI